MADPQSSAELDAGLQKFIKSANRIRWYTAIGVGAFLLAAVLVLGYLVLQDQQRLEASCSFYHDVAVAPLPVKVAPGRQPSELGVAIVVHARYTYIGQGCAGKLTPPGPGLVKWARFYRLPILR